MLSTLTALVALAPLSVPVYVDGDGYLRLARDGRTVYAKQAELTVVDGKLACKGGPLLNPRVQVPDGAESIKVDLQGRVLGTYSGVERELGKLVLALFPEGVRLVVDNGFLVSSYRPTIVEPGGGTAGVVRMGTPGEATVIVIAPATVAAGVTVRLNESAEIGKGAFTLGDIAVVEADPATKARIEALEVSTTPALGAHYKMTQEMVRTRLLRYGKEAEQYKFSGSNQVTVTRKGQEVSQAMFAEAAIAAVKKRLGEATPLTCDGFGPAMVVPAGRLELTVEDIAENGPRLAVRVAAVVDGARFNSRTVTVEKADAISKMRVGATVKVFVVSGSLRVETTGRIRSIDLANGTVSVTTATGADLIGKPTAEGAVEVKA